MNSIHLRKGAVPLTPNLEDYKQKNKSRSRRKGVIQPTNPPTPKITRGPLTLKNHDREPQFCPMHPDRIAIHHIDSGKTKFCTKCYLLTCEDVRPQQVQTEKKKELDEFRKKIKSFGLKLEEADESIRGWCIQSEQNYYRQKQYISECFETLRISLQEKQRQLLSILMSSQQKIKRNLVRGSQEVEQIKKAICRYIQDIENHYQDIIESLSYEQFNQILQKYHSKIKYFQNGIEDLTQGNSINAFIPVKDMQKLINRSTVQVYPELPLQESTNHTQTLARHPTEKGNLYLQTGSRGYHTHQQSKIGHRQSRQRQFFRPNKQNHNFDNHFYH